jgi:uncharacterized protein (TIGR02452 family)
MSVGSVLGVSNGSGGGGSAPTELLLVSALDAALSEKSARRGVLRRLWCAAAFREAARNALAVHDFRLLKAQRQLVQVGTLDALLRARYFLESGARVEFDRARLAAAVRSTVKLEPAVPLSPADSSADSSASPLFVAVMRGDCLDAAIAVRRALGRRTALLNMANESNPGGGWLSGSAAQEENLCRRSGLIFCLADPFRLFPAPAPDLYPIAEFAVVYSKNVPVFRGSEADGYPFLDTVFWLGVLTAPAYRHPPTQPDAAGRDVLDEKWRGKLRQKARALLRCAALKRERALVLSAWGCGAFANPPAEVAQAFFDILHDAEFRGRFDAVVFAILEDHNSQRGGNLPPFAAAFGVNALDSVQALEHELQRHFTATEQEQQPPAAAACDRREHAE